MNERNKKIFIGIAGASSALAIAFLGYKAYKTYKMVKEEYGEPEDVLEELDTLEYVEKSEDRMRIIQEHWDEVDERAEQEDEERYFDPEMSFSRVNAELIKTDDGYIDTEDEIRERYALRHDPNSEEAMEQYKDYRLADIEDHHISYILRGLFGWDFKPFMKKDELIFEHIQQERVDFFGPDSDFNEEASVAELILHFATLSDFDNDGGVEHWAIIILENLGFEPRDDRNMVDDWMDSVLDAVMKHEFYNDDWKGTGEVRFGIFGLDPRDPEVDLEEMSFMQQYWRAQPDELDI